MTVVTNSRENKKYFMELIRKASLRVTPGRVAILSLLAATKKPITANEILTKLKSSSPDQATVYRALNELKSTGLIRQIDFQHGHAHYEFASDDDHHHLICTNCEKVEDIDCCEQSMMKIAIQKSKNFKEINKHSFEIFGICKACAAR